jgi:hypothetical protein
MLFKEVQFSELSMDALFVAHKNQYIQRYALDYLTEGKRIFLEFSKKYRVDDTIEECKIIRKR